MVLTATFGVMFEVRLLRSCRDICLRLDVTGNTNQLGSTAAAATLLSGYVVAVLPVLHLHLGPVYQLYQSSEQCF